MNTKHTPGPWVAEKPYRMWQINAPHCKIPALRDVGTVLADADADPSAAEANARLIAAAPDLLAACEAALASFHQAHAHDRKSRCACELVTEAIAKARGGA